MHIIVTTGGSGGHIYPALAVMNRLNDEGYKVTFVGRSEGMEKNIIGNSFPYIDIDVIGFKGLSFKSIKAYMLLRNAKKKLIKQFTRLHPDLVIGFGNYVSAPAVDAAIKLDIPTIIHEQNFELGKYNALVKQKVDKLLTSYEDTDGIFVGNPRSEEFYKKYQKKFHVGINVLMFAGSQGSEIFNKFLIDNANAISKMKCNFHFVTGIRHYETVLKAKIEYNNIFIYKYIDDMPSFIADKDICITRAGATTIAEFASIGMPLILVPSPYVTNNHQYKNAKELSEKKACILVKESEINTVLSELDNLINGDLYTLQRNFKKIAKIDSIEVFVKQVKEVLGE